jgi:flavin-dependent dehydrogenase
MYDVIIVGARCAGAATARLLAQRGHKVLMVDRATFPSDTISGHYITHIGVRKLYEWGLLDQVLGLGCVPINTLRSDFGDGILQGTIQAPDGIPACLGPRRYELDTLLAESAVAAGAEFWQGCLVEGLLYEGDRVVGIKARTENGQHVEQRAKLVIGADGKNSSIARMVGAEVYHDQPSLTCWYLNYWENLPCEGLESHWRPGRLAFAFPVTPTQTFVGVCWPHREFHDFRSDIEGNYRKTILSMTSLADRWLEARPLERYVGMADLPNFFRTATGLGWALIGDASHHKDPVLARGMSDAFYDADQLCNAVDSGLRGETSLDQALAEYQTNRDARYIPDLDANIGTAHLVGWDAPDNLRLRAALRKSPVDAGLSFAVQMRVFERDSFYNPQNIERILTSYGD